VCFGAATKFSHAGLEADKAYRATLRLGQTRVGGDLEGEVVRERPVAFDAGALREAARRLTGPIEQVPPMHSAIKHEGRALYELARQGVEVERAPRRVTIHRLDIVRWQAEELVIDVVCGRGTYIRTLAEDLGEALGCGAHLSALRRTGSGMLRVEEAATLEALEGMDEAARDALLLPADALLLSLPLVRLPADEAGRFLCGLRRRVALADAAAVRVYGPQPRAFLGSAHISGGELIADRLLSPSEVATVLDTAAAAPPSRPSSCAGQGENGALTRVNA
jgi:tRNA pseudouridine55 synthase